MLSSAEKPLPNPPVAQIISESTLQTRSLIDASERPLRRSPPGNPHLHEEWPVLFPAKPTAANSLRHSAQSGDVTVLEKPAPRLIEASEPHASLMALEKDELTRSTTRKSVNAATEVRDLDPSEGSVDPKMSLVNIPDETALHNTVEGTTTGRSTVPKAVVKKLTKASKDFKYPRQTKTSTLRARQSSIPTPRRNENTPANIEGTNPPPRSLSLEKAKTHSRKASNVFEEPRNGVGNGEQVKKRMTDPVPMHQYIIKRLSTTTPDHGPILRISHSAERIIMGKDSDKENKLKLDSKSGRDLRRAVTSKELHKAIMTTSASGDNEQQPERPHSSQCLSQCDSPLDLKNGEERDKKVRSVEVEYALSKDHLHEGPASFKTLGNRMNTKSIGSDDPFFDARSIQEQSNGVVHNDPGNFPPRNSSRLVVPKYTSPPVSPSNTKRRSSDEFVIRQNKLGQSQGMGSSQIVHAGGQLKRESTTGLSTSSQVSLSKTVLSNFRGLFHKRSGDHPIKAGKPKVTVTRNGSPFPPMSEVHPVHRPTLASTSLRKHPTSQLNIEVPTPVTPMFKSPGPSEVAAMTTLAMNLLDSARLEVSSPKKEKYLEMGRVMVDAVTQAREAEKAMVEAKHAARKAEVAYLRCAKSVGDIAKNVQEWRDDMEK